MRSLPNICRAAGATALRAQAENVRASPHRIAPRLVTGTPISSNCTVPIVEQPPPRSRFGSGLNATPIRLRSAWHICVWRALGPDAAARRWSAGGVCPPPKIQPDRSEEHTSELQSLMRNPYAVFCLKKNNQKYILEC